MLRARDRSRTAETNWSTKVLVLIGLKDGDRSITVRYNAKKHVCHWYTQGPESRHNFVKYLIFINISVCEIEGLNYFSGACTI